MSTEKMIADTIDVLLVEVAEGLRSPVEFVDAMADIVTVLREAAS